MQTLVIGDIHGCFVEMQRLLEKVGLSEGDRIIAVGDIVDRGPETPQVLDFFRQTPKALALMGNHERKHVRAARHEVKLSNSQKISRIQLEDGYAAAVAWMGGMPLYLDLSDAVIVHGYFEPGVPLEAQNPSVICGTMGGERVLRQRYDRPWYELYDGEKPIIVGHLNYGHSTQPFVYQERVFGLDTDCVLGKALTGLLLPSFQFVSVTSRGNLWTRVRQTYRLPLCAATAKGIAPIWTDQDNLALKQVMEKAEQANRILLDRLQATPGYADLAPRQQAKAYAAEAGAGLFAMLMHMARVQKLTLELAQAAVKNTKALAQLLNI